MVKHTLVVSIDYDPLQYDIKEIAAALSSIALGLHNDGHAPTEIKRGNITARTVVLIPKSRVDPPRDEP